MLDIAYLSDKGYRYGGRYTEKERDRYGGRYTEKERDRILELLVNDSVPLATNDFGWAATNAVREGRGLSFQQRRVAS